MSADCQIPRREVGGGETEEAAGALEAERRDARGRRNLDAFLDVLEAEADDGDPQLPLDGLGS